MAQEQFEDLVDTFEYLQDWEDRYAQVIDMGKAMPLMPDVLKVPATKVDGCASQVWLHATTDGGILRFQGDSDAMIVKGLIAVLHHLYDGLSIDAARAVDAPAELARLGLNDHLSSQRSNGLRAMVQRLQQIAGNGP
ncbi:MAG: SufE family protein [Pseudomonadota bacterium]